MEPLQNKGLKYQLKNRIRNNFLHFLTRKSLSRSNKIIAVSNYVKTYLSANKYLNSNSRIEVIHHGVEQNNSSNIDSRKKIIFSAGSLLPYRKYEDLIEAFDLIAHKFPEYKLVIAGGEADSRYWKFVKNKIQNSKYSKQIYFLGKISREEMTYNYLKCQILSPLRLGG